MTTPLYPPVNVIFLNDDPYQSKEDILDDHMDILDSCKSEQDYRSLMSLVYDAAVNKMGEIILQKQIRMNAEILEGLRNNI
jgi:hypothetical protein